MSLRISLRLDNETAACLKEIAQFHGLTLQETIREIVAYGMCRFCPRDCERKRRIEVGETVIIPLDDLDIHIRILRKKD